MDAPYADGEWGGDFQELQTEVPAVTLASRVPANAVGDAKDALPRYHRRVMLGEALMAAVREAGRELFVQSAAAVDFAQEKPATIAGKVSATEKSASILLEPTPESRRRVDYRTS